MKRIILIVICISMLITSIGCDVLFPKEEETEKEVIPYLDNYFINANTPTASHGYEAYTYKSSESEPLSMGGHDYHGGFKLWTTYGPTEYGYATFSLEGKSYKNMSFALGSYNPNGNYDDYYNIVSVEVDGKQVIDALVWGHSVPERYTIDVAGAKEVTFKIIEGEASVGVAELTVWEGEAQVTGYVKDNPARKQLVNDLMPYFCKNNNTNVIFTQNTYPQYSDLYWMQNDSLQKEPVTVAGIKHSEGFALYMSIPLIGDDVNYMYFNTEGDYEYLTFTVGCGDLANVAEGKSWLSVFADGERVYEEHILSSALPITVTVPIKGCNELKFETKFDDGGNHYITVFDAYVGKTQADSSGTASENNGLDQMGEVSKLISNLKPYFINSAEEKPVFDGSTQYHTFSMAGRKYNEGVILYSSASFLTGNEHAHVSFNLDGNFKYLTFTSGILDKSPTLADDKLNIYLDGVLTESIDMHALYLPVSHTIDLRNCKELKIELEGMDAMVRPAYGIADMVVYRNTVVENDLFAREPNHYPDSMPLIENLKPFKVYASALQNGDNQVLFDGSTKQEYFTVDGRKIYSGIILETSVHLSLGTEGMALGMMMNAMLPIYIFGGALGIGLAAAEEVHECSLAAFDFDREFTKVTFTVACLDPDGADNDWSFRNKEDKLFIGNDEEVAKEIIVSADMKPTTYTVELHDCERFMFWLDCGELSSLPYAIYDISVEK